MSATSAAHYSIPVMMSSSLLRLCEKELEKMKKGRKVVNEFSELIQQVAVHHRHDSLREREDSTGHIAQPNATAAKRNEQQSKAVVQLTELTN